MANDDIIFPQDEFIRLVFYLRKVKMKVGRAAKARTKAKRTVRI
jgi:hypothetical protein